MTPLIQTAIVVGASVVVAIALVRVLAYVAFTRLTDDSTEIDDFE
jgi:hypothetical protein